MAPFGVELSGVGETIGVGEAVGERSATTVGSPSPAGSETPAGRLRPVPADGSADAPDLDVAVEEAGVLVGVGVGVAAATASGNPKQESASAEMHESRPIVRTFSISAGYGSRPSAAPASRRPVISLTDKRHRFS